MIKKRVMNSLSVLCMLLLVVLIVLIAKKTNVQLDNYMIFGEKIGNNEYENVFMKQVDNEKIRTSNSTFTSQVESKTFLKMLQENVAKKIDNKMVPIQDVIQKSNYISIYIGNTDFIDKIKFDKTTKEANYDLEVLQRQIDMTTLNVYHIIEEIKNINEYCKIIVLSTYFPYYDLESHALEELQNFFNTFNDELEQLCKDSNASYLDISLLGKSNYFLESTYTINDAGHQYLGNKIYQCAIDEIC